MPSLLQVRNLVASFHTTKGVIHAVNNVSFDLAQGETLAIVGESGSGKSVTMLSLLQLIPDPPGKIEAGEAIFLDGEVKHDLLKLAPEGIRRIRGGQIGMIFQDPLTSLNPVLKIGAQIAEVLVEHLSMNDHEARDRTIELLEHVGIPGAREHYDNYPHQFSGGMRQRVMIAMAIACTPKILIADEPTTALDVTIQAQILDLVGHLRDELGVAVIWITHDLGVVAGLAERVIVMYGGMVMEQAPVETLYEHPQHPYTIGLLGALPHLEKTRGQRLTSIRGTPPDMLIEPSHCPFAWRCAYVFERCWQELPPLISVGEQHTAACFFDVRQGRPRGDI